MTRASNNKLKYFLSIQLFTRYDTMTTATATATALEVRNPHPRDAHIHFEEGPHKYTIQGINGVTADTEFTSVTTFVHGHFEHFNAKEVIAAMMGNTKKWNDPVANAKYYGKTAEEIEEMWSKAGRDAAAKGTEMHYKIECFYNDVAADTADTDTAPPELQYFKNFHNEFVAREEPTLRPYRTEWTVFHEEAQIAGSIDMVYEVVTRESRRRGTDPPPRHLRLETMPRHRENQPRQQIRHPPRHRAPPRHELLALRASIEYIQVYSTNKIRQNRHRPLPRRPSPRGTKLPACQTTRFTS